MPPDLPQLLGDPQLDALAASALCEPRDRTGWNQLRGQVESICGLVCRGPKSAEYRDDVTQETCLKIETTSGKSAGYKRGRRFRPWCARIAKNALIDILRRVGRQPDPLPEGDFADTAIEPDWSVLHDDSRPMSVDDVLKSQALFRKVPDAAVQVFAVSWLWKFLPEDDWMAWLKECGIPTPWPPMDVLNAPNPRWAILTEVAATFGITPDSVRTKVDRYRWFLQSLDRLQR